jgi:cytoskeleton-associated protein 5
MEQTHGLKPASKATILPLIASAKAAAPAPAARQAAAAAPARSATPAKTGPTASRPKVLGSRTIICLAYGTGRRSESLHCKGSAWGGDSSSGSRRYSSGLHRFSRKQPPLRALPPSLPPSPPRPSKLKSWPKTSGAVTGSIWAAKYSARSLDVGSKTHRCVSRLRRVVRVFGQLFSKDHRAEEDFMAGLTVLAEFFDRTAPTIFGAAEDDIKAFQVANVDLVLKYAALRLLSNNTHPRSVHSQPA